MYRSSMFRRLLALVLVATFWGAVGFPAASAQSTPCGSTPGDPNPPIGEPGSAAGSAVLLRFRLEYAVTSCGLDAGASGGVLDAAVADAAFSIIGGKISKRVFPHAVPGRLPSTLFNKTFFSGAHTRRIAAESFINWLTGETLRLSVTPVYSGSEGYRLIEIVSTQGLVTTSSPHWRKE